uniref:Uncharacterized protein n=1 Tax=Strongyloides stercoralis TaxID=6248 RepID=A0AAF5DL74_STRER
MIREKCFIVKINETFFTRRKRHCQRMLAQQCCFKKTCRKIKECFVEPVPDRSSNTSIEMSGRRKEYSQIAESGCEHLKVNNKYNFVNSLTNAFTQNIERGWRSAKEKSRRQNGTCKFMLEGYMYELT